MKIFILKLQKLLSIYKDTCHNNQFSKKILQVCKEYNKNKTIIKKIFEYII